ncbi:MAG: DUF177 domain-containing protein [Novosphingobium sp.]|uniref:YceD family protein n=1 Tax=Novosphingobium sp. TaxID=1874826 RepID=UPI0017A4D323|nr:DUF177 domain-containing protein [Novosphingobium sp.]
MSEFQRIYALRTLPSEPQTLTATADECTALTRRFALVAVKRFTATITLVADGANVRANGTLDADIVQSCAVSGDDLPMHIAAPVALRFVPAGADAPGDETVELSADELDDIEMDGTQFDLGEALAQELALAINPYAEGPGAAEARRKAGIVSEGEAGPFAGLAALKKSLE